MNNAVRVWAERFIRCFVTPCLDVWKKPLSEPEITPWLFMSTWLLATLSFGYQAEFYQESLNKEYDQKELNLNNSQIIFGDGLPMKGGGVMLSGGLSGGFGPGEEDDQRHQRRPWMPMQASHAFSYTLLPNLKLPEGFENDIPDLRSWYYLLDILPKKESGTLRFQSHNQPPVDSHLDFHDYQDLLRHMKASSEGLLNWLAPKISGRESLIHLLLDLQQFIINGSSVAGLAGFNKIKYQLAALLEQHDKEFNKELETEVLQSTLATSWDFSSDKGITTLPLWKKRQSKEKNLKPVESPSEPSKTDFTKPGMPAKGNTPNQSNGSPSPNPPSREAASNASEQVSQLIFHIIVDGQPGSINSGQLKKDSYGQDDTGSIKVEFDDQDHPIQCSLNQIEEKLNVPEAQRLSGREAPCIDYFYQYGTAQTLMDLLTFYSQTANSGSNNHSEEYQTFLQAFLHFYKERSDLHTNSPINNLLKKKHHAIAERLGKISEASGRMFFEIINTHELKQTPLHQAALDGDLKKVTQLISSGSDPFEKDSAGVTALHAAAIGGHSELVRKLIIEHGCKPDEKDNTGSSILHAAAANGHSDLVRQLITEHGANPDEKDHSGSSVMHVAAANDHRAIVSELLAEHSADRFSVDNNGWSVLHVAAARGHTGIVWALVRTFNFDVNLLSKNWFYITPLHLAAENNHSGTIKELVKLGANIESQTYLYLTPLHYAARSGAVDAIHALKKLGADPDAASSIYFEKMTPLHLAVIETKHESIKPLIKKEGDKKQGADVNKQSLSGRTPLIMAVRKPEDNKVFLRDRTIALERSEETIKALVTWGRANLETTKNPEQWTALHYVAMEGNTELTTLLLNLGANINHPDNLGRTPLFWAASGNHPDTVQILANNKARLEQQSNNGRTPLHEASARGHKEATELLIKLKAKPEAREHTGATALHLAAANKQHATLRVLLESHADLETRNKKGRAGVHRIFEKFQPADVEKLIFDFPHLFTRDALNIRSDDDKLPIDLMTGKGDEIVFLAGLTAPEGGLGQKALFAATSANRIERITRLIHFGVDLAGEDKNGWTALHHATEKQHKDSAALIAEKVDKNTLNALTPVSWTSWTNSETAAHMAVKSGNLELMEILLKNGARLDVPNNQKKTPLHAAIQFLSAEKLQLFHRLAKDQINGYLMHLADSYGKTPIQVLRERQDIPLDLVDLFMHHTEKNLFWVTIVEPQYVLQKGYQLNYSAGFPINVMAAALGTFDIKTTPFKQGADTMSGEVEIAVNEQQEKKETFKYIIRSHKTSLDSKTLVKIIVISPNNDSDGNAYTIRIDHNKNPNPNEDEIALAYQGLGRLSGHPFSPRYLNYSSGQHGNILISQAPEALLCNLSAIQATSREAFVQYWGADHPLSHLDDQKLSEEAIFNVATRLTEGFHAVATSKLHITRFEADGFGLETTTMQPFLADPTLIKTNASGSEWPEDPVKYLGKQFLLLSCKALECGDLEPDEEHIEAILNQNGLSLPQNSWKTEPELSQSASLLHNLALLGAAMLGKTESMQPLQDLTWVLIRLEQIKKRYTSSKDGYP